MSYKQVIFVEIFVEVTKIRKPLNHKQIILRGLYKWFKWIK